MILAIYCAGGLGKEVYDLALYVNRARNLWTDIVFVDDVKEEKTYCGTAVYEFSEMESIRKDLEFIIANGEPKIREV